MTFTIDGPPRTKKNHGRVIMRAGRRFHVPSEAHESWAESAVAQLRRQCEKRKLFTAKAERTVTIQGTCVKGMVPVVFACAVNARARIYRAANTGDAVGYYQAIADVLESAGVVENDRLIVAWDGSRLLIDRHLPRVEITLEPLEVT